MFQREYLSDHLLMLVGFAGIVGVWLFFNNFIRESDEIVSASPAPTAEVLSVASPSASFFPNYALASFNPIPVLIPKSSIVPSFAPSPVPVSSPTPTSVPSQVLTGGVNDAPTPTPTSTPASSPSGDFEQNKDPNLINLPGRILGGVGDLL